VAGVIAVLGWFRKWKEARERRAEEAAKARAEAEKEDEEEEEAAAGDEDGGAAPLTQELDLHTFLPKECADVVDEYLRAAQEAGFTAVRIIHGKGTGAMRRTVHAVLDRHPAVRGYQLAGATRGSWGATLVELLPRDGGGDAT
jgi:dsDNA-specific endonuclease/ATPase MutS2